MRIFSLRGASSTQLAHSVARRLFRRAAPERLHGGEMTFDPAAWSTLPPVPGGLLIAEFEEGWLHFDQKAQTISGNLRWPIDPAACLDALADIPWQSAAFAPVHPEWTYRDYQSPLYLPQIGFGEGHVPFGYAVALRDDALDGLLSPRLLSHGPWRTHRSKDAAFIQFHALDATASEAHAQALPGHALLSMAWLGGTPLLAKGLRGIWHAADRSLRFLWAEPKPPSPRQMLTAVALSRAQPPERPVERVDFVFMEPATAQNAHTDLWLRGLGCRFIDDHGAEIILDDAQVVRPAWIG